MSINFDLTKIADFESLYEDAPSVGGEPRYRIIPKYDAIIFPLSAFIHLGTITPDNLAEWAFRLSVLAQANITVLRTPAGTKYNPSIDDVVRMTGLEVNVTPRTRAGFLKDVARILSERATTAQREFTEKHFARTPLKAT
jgi:hypothetical protein